MATINPQFRIKEANSKGDCQIFMRAYFDNQRFTYYTGFSIKQKYWLKEENRPITAQAEYIEGKLTKDDLRKNREILSNMKRCAAETERIYGHWRYDGIIPSTKKMKEELDKKFKKKEQEGKTEFLTEYVHGFISRTNKKYYTIRNYKTTLNHLKGFEKKRNRRIRMDEINLDFYDAFMKYFLNKGKSTNTIGTHIKNLKVFLADAEERGQLVNQDYKLKRFKVVEEKSPSMYLTLDEIGRIKNLDLSKQEELDRVRDLFLIGCYTGVRYSDYHQVNYDHVFRNDKGTFLKVKTTKTGDTVVIPLRPEVIFVLEKYGENLPKPISNQKMNVHLKTIAQKAKLNETVPISITKGGLAVEKIKKKSELVTTHTARRSFATNAFLAGVPAIALMKITGHKTEKSFMRYINMSQEDNAYHMAQHQFFRG